MDKFLLTVGRLAGLAGALLCAAAVMLRVSGRYVIGSFQLGTLLIAGIAVMTAACFCLLLFLANRHN